MEALRIISEEHRNLWRIASTLDSVAEEMAAGQPVESAFFSAIFDYIEEFMDGCHHAKEDEYLFPCLRQRSAEAAKEIKALISESVEKVVAGTQLVDQAGQTMDEVVGAIQRVKEVVGQIRAAISEQSSGVSQIGQAVNQMDQVTQQNAALVEESSAAAQGLRVQAQQLAGLVEAFRLPAGAGGQKALR